MKVIIMRGIPGSGKSTWIDCKYELSKRVICSADHYFTRFIDGGNYIFDQNKLREAHNFCLRNFTAILTYEEHEEVEGLRDRTLIVDNTNIRVFEIAPYYRLAEAFGAQVEIVWCQCNPNIALSRQTHAVPENKVWEMWKSFEAIPPWWNMVYVNTDKE